MYDAITSATRAIPVKGIPTHATYRESRSPSTKYQPHGHARNSLRQCIRLGSGFRQGCNDISPITVYKFVDGEYIAIFDSYSDLAAAFKSNKITEDELFNLIDW
jgi:hypothetical protein